MIWSFVAGVATTIVFGFVYIGFAFNVKDRRQAFGDCLDQNPMNWRGIIRLLLGGSVGNRKAPAVITKNRSTRRGNIRTVHGEEADLVPRPSDVHLFPQFPAAKTVFEEFNRRLFIHNQLDDDEPWPETTLDDFPTLLSVAPEQLVKACHRYLRPGYPVIIDHYGWWKGASGRLEQDDTYTDPVIATYLAMPEHQRPVVISSQTTDGESCLVFLRYGFEPFSIRRSAMDPHLTASLHYLFKAFIGVRQDWMWLSVARMRKSVMSTHRAELALMADIKKEVAAINETVRQAAQRRHANRFAALWDPPLEEATASTGAIDEPTAPTAVETEPKPKRKPARRKASATADSDSTTDNEPGGPA